jgi:hypothetical protein
MSDHEMDFDRIALRLAERAGFYVDGDMMPAIAEELRRMWNARGAVDLATVQAELSSNMSSAAAGPCLKNLNRILRSLDAPGTENMMYEREPDDSNRATTIATGLQQVMDALEPIDAVNVLYWLLNRVLVRLNSDARLRVTAADALEEIGEASRLIVRAVHALERVARQRTVRIAESAWSHGEAP